MASKKSRSKAKQSRSSGNPSNYSQLYKGDSSGVPVAKGSSTKTTAAATAATVETNDTVNWQTEYAYVFKDLRTLFIVSLVLFAAMLVIGFFI